MFKVGMALAFSVIAALVVFLTGLFTDARIGTAFLRSLIAFVCAGAFTYLVTFILEAKGWTAYDKMPDERMEDMKKIVYDADDIDFDAEDDGAEEGNEAPKRCRSKPGVIEKPGKEYDNRRNNGEYERHSQFKQNRHLP